MIIRSFAKDNITSPNSHASSEMIMSGLTDRYGKQIAGTIKCLDRVVITGTLPTACYANGMTGCLYAKQIRIFDYFDFIKPLKDGIHENAKRIGQSRRPRNARSRRDRHYRKL